jgi:hypothetical protein
MHDSKGRAISVGDVVLANTWYSDGKQRLLKVAGGASQSDSCNLYCSDDVQGSPVGCQITLTAKETTVVFTREGEFIGT